MAGQGRAYARQTHGRVRLEVRRSGIGQRRYRHSQGGRQDHPMAHTLGASLPWSETFSVGIDTSTSVDEKDYQVPFEFTGKLNKLTVKVGPKQVSAEEKAAVEKKQRDRQ